MNKTNQDVIWKIRTKVSLKKICLEKTLIGKSHSSKEDEPYRLYLRNCSPNIVLYHLKLWDGMRKSVYRSIRAEVGKDGDKVENLYLRRNTFLQIEICTKFRLGDLIQSKQDDRYLELELVKGKVPEVGRRMRSKSSPVVPGIRRLKERTLPSHLSG